MTKFFLPGAFHVFDARDENARVAGDKPARLDQNFQAERPEQRHQPPGVFLRRQNVLRRGGFPPGGGAAGERGFIDNAQPAADAEKFQRVFFPQPFHERQDFAHRLLKRASSQ